MIASLTSAERPGTQHSARLVMSSSAAVSSVPMGRPIPVRFSSQISDAQANWLS